MLSTGWGHGQFPTFGGVVQDDRLQFTSAPGSSIDPNFPSTNVARFELRPYYGLDGTATGDVTDTGGYVANRVEVYDRIATRGTPAPNWPDRVGSTRWYSFGIYLPPDFPTDPSKWFDFVRWKGLDTGSPPIAMEIRDNRFYLGGQHSSKPLGWLHPGIWTHFVIGLNFSDGTNTGWATAYCNGSLVVDGAPTQTMNDQTVNGATVVDPNYLKMGIYRSATWNVTQVIYLSPMKIGTTLASVS